MTLYRLRWYSFFCTNQHVPRMPTYYIYTSSPTFPSSAAIHTCAYRATCLFPAGLFAATFATALHVYLAPVYHYCADAFYSLLTGFCCKLVLGPSPVVARLLNVTLLGAAGRRVANFGTRTERGAGAS